MVSSAGAHVNARGGSSWSKSDQRDEAWSQWQCAPAGCGSSRLLNKPSGAGSWMPMMSGRTRLLGGLHWSGHSVRAVEGQKRSQPMPFSSVPQANPLALFWLGWQHFRAHSGRLGQSSECGARSLEQVGRLSTFGGLQLHAATARPALWRFCVSNGPQRTNYADGPGPGWGDTFAQTSQPHRRTYVPTSRESNQPRPPFAS